MTLDMALFIKKSGVPTFDDVTATYTTQFGSVLCERGLAVKQENNI